MSGDCRCQNCRREVSRTLKARQRSRYRRDAAREIIQALATGQGGPLSRRLINLYQTRFAASPKRLVDAWMEDLDHAKRQGPSAACDRFSVMNRIFLHAEQDCVQTLAFRPNPVTLSDEELERELQSHALVWLVQNPENLRWIYARLGFRLIPIPAAAVQ